jgi:hypothetical protein
MEPRCQWFHSPIPQQIHSVATLPEINLAASVTTCGLPGNAWKRRNVETEGLLLVSNPSESSLPLVAHCEAWHSLRFTSKSQTIPHSEWAGCQFILGCLHCGGGPLWQMKANFPSFTPSFLPPFPSASISWWSRYYSACWEYSPGIQSIRPSRGLYSGVTEKEINKVTRQNWCHEIVINAREKSGESKSQKEEVKLQMGGQQHSQEKPTLEPKVSEGASLQISGQEHFRWRKLKHQGPVADHGQQVGEH